MKNAQEGKAGVFGAELTRVLCHIQTCTAVPQQDAQEYREFRNWKSQQIIKFLIAVLHEMLIHGEQQKLSIIIMCQC